MKKITDESIKSRLMLIVAFIVSMAVGYLLVSQFQQSILRAWINGPGTSQSTEQVN